MISIRNLSVKYADTEVLHNIDLEVNRGEFVTLLGPSGCGKSTLLRAIGGFVSPSSGTIDMEGRNVTRLDPEQRGVGFVFQSYALFPHLSVEDNVGFGLSVRKIRGLVRRQRIADALAVTGLTDFAAKMPSQLSGGQQQRVAIARVLVTQPSVLLMDEPLSNLDAQLRITLRAEIQRLHRDLGITTLYVTHDQEEALSLSDRVAVMGDGQIEQFASPQAVYQRPETDYVCTFVGDVNRIDDTIAPLFGLDTQPGHNLYVRPERVRVDIQRTAAQQARGIVSSVTFLGAITRYVVRLGESELLATATSVIGNPLAAGTEVWCGFDAADTIRLAS